MTQKATPMKWRRQRLGNVKRFTPNFLAVLDTQGAPDCSCESKSKQRVHKWKMRHSGKTDPVFTVRLGQQLEELIRVSLPAFE